MLTLKKSISTFAKHTSTTTGTAINYVIRPAEVETWKNTITKPIPLLIRIEFLNCKIFVVLERFIVGWATM